jgi:hypothetical protein
MVLTDKNANGVKTFSQKTSTLMGPDKKLYKSETPGTYGGHRKTKVYGRMDCPVALRAIEKGGYVRVTGTVLRCKHSNNHINSHIISTIISQ